MRDLAPLWSLSDEPFGNPAFQEAVGRKALHGEVKVYPVEHLDFYHGLPDAVVRDQIAFLSHHLLP